MPQLEREWRVWRGDLELRAAADGSQTLAGSAAVFQSYSRNLGGFVEQIDPAAFNDTLARGGNVVALMNHDPNMLLGDTRSGTLTLTPDAKALNYSVALDSGDPDAQRVAAKVQRGLLRGSSFSFRTVADTWSETEQGFPLRTLLAVELYDVGPVAMPAYPATEVGTNAVALRSLAAHVGEPFERLQAAAAENRLAEFLGTPKPDTGPGEQPSRPALTKWASRFGVHVAGH